MRDRLKSIIWLAVAFLIVTSIAIAATLWKLRQDIIQDTLTDTRNLATILARQADNSAQAIELVLDELISETRRNILPDADAYEIRVTTQEMHHAMRERLSRLPQADVITFTDAAGKVLNITRTWPTPEISLKERDYFIHFSTQQGNRLFVSEPVRNKMTGHWTTYFAKRLETMDGTFLGVILIGARPELFTNAFSALSSKLEANFALVRNDGLILSSFPQADGRAGKRIPASSPWHALKASGGDYRSTEHSEDQVRLVAVEPLRHFPLVVKASVNEDAALNVWRMRAAVIASGSMALELALVLLLRALYNHLDSLAQSEQRLRTVNMRFDATISNLSTGLALCDANGRIMLHNAAFARIWPYDAKGGTQALKPLLAEARAALLLEMPGARSVDTISQRADGHSIRVTLDALPDGGWVTTHEDITEQVEAKARIAYLAQHDPLTGLANRATCTDALTQLMHEEAAFTLMLIDIDHFKEVNDTFGHGVGDELLLEVAHNLAHEVGTQGSVARWGGDEFVILHRIQDGTVDSGIALAARLIDAINLPKLFKDRDITPSISLGLVHSHSGLIAPEDVMRCADLALYAAKMAGRNRFAVFEPSMDEAYRSRQQQIQDLRQAIAQDALHVEYQPIVEPRNGRIISMEALARWDHPVQGRISPVLFIPLAEESGQINELGKSILRKACHEAISWPESIKVAVNVSGVQMAHAGFVEFISTVLHETGLAPERLELEITETVFLSDSQRALTLLDSLRLMGIRISLDDFGTGYSSLGYLHRFPFDKLKIDKSFIDHITSDSGCTAIISATLALAREFNITSVAEGVETPTQRDILLAGGVNQIQGYLYGRPARAEVWAEQGWQLEAPAAGQDAATAALPPRRSGVS